MVLTGFDLYHYRLPLSAALTFGNNVLQEREGFLIRLESDTGRVGWGEASPVPGYSRESIDEARQQLGDLRASLRGWTITADWIAWEGAFMHYLDGIGLVASVRFGLELALWNLYAAVQGKALVDLIAPQPRAAVSLNGLLMGSTKEILEGARAMRFSHFPAVKLKVGRRSVEEDVELVKGVRHILGPGVGLRLDANRAWSLSEAIDLVKGISGVRVEYIEEPLVDPRLLSHLAEQYNVAIALDETLADLPLAALSRHAYARAVILKPTLLGGLVATLRMAQRATALGMKSVLSAAYETGVGTLGLIALAAGLGPDDVPAGLDTYRWLAEDVITPRLSFQQGRVDVATALGAKRAIQARLLKKVS